MDLLTNEHVGLQQAANAGKILQNARELDSNLMHNFMGASRSIYFTQNNYNTTKKRVPAWFINQKNKVPVKVGRKPGRNEINPATGRKYKFGLN
mgnify:CR=1 FL=1